MILEAFEETIQHLLDACKKVYGRDLITLAVFGSVARGTPNPNSDIDIMLVIKNLPSCRMKRMQQFDEVGKMMEPWISSLKKYQIYTMLSPVIKTP
ncbi:nucleotidyltransferase domain-containing protein [Biomaibacter acetigenes]|uniref:nucleotidyltransferase domain-containing protein n=1 Tax=Biomaibacter acetigenes TaxID=2316383 RepID=UPI001CA3AE89|nr:nucleotidyltransferase domain-containing protein [Biomaibacter acetigenes]